MPALKPITQCLQCRRIKDNGRWILRNLPASSCQVSHTYCERCLGAIRSNLGSLVEFQSWDFPRQVEYLRREVTAADHNHFDRPALAAFLEETFGITGERAQTLCEALVPQLVPLACPLCREEILPEQKRQSLGTRLFHRVCHLEMKEKIRILLENEWDLSGKLDAYLDLLQVEKRLRTLVKAELRAHRELAAKVQPSQVALRA